MPNSWLEQDQFVQIISDPHYSLYARWNTKDESGRIQIYGHGIQSIEQSGMPCARFGINYAWVPVWVADACVRYSDAGGYGGMTLCQFLKKLNADNPIEVVKLKVSVIEALEKLESAPLGNARKAMLKAVDQPILRDVLFYALSPDVTFGMKKLPEANHTSVKFQLDDDWYCDLVRMLDRMKERDDGSRELSGSAAKVAVAQFLGQCNDVQRKWAERVILQDLRLSIGAKDINAVLDEVVIPLFALPLAKQFKELKSLKGRWCLQTKMDGGRVVVRMPAKGGPVSMLSRTGKEWPGFHSVRASLNALNKTLNNSEEMTLDGEVAVFRNGRMDFQECQRLFHKKGERTPNGDLRFVAFDFCTSKEYDNPKRNYEERFNDLKQMFYKNVVGSFKDITLIDSTIVIDPSKAELDAIAEKYVLELGCDGAIIRRADKPPTNKKTSDITKIKPFEDGEAVIIDKVEGKGWLAGSLGTLVCQMYDPKKKVPYGPQFEIGTGEGLTKELRQEMWDDPDLIGKIVNFKYQRLSEDNVPILNTFRAIRHPDDIGA